MLRTDFCEKTSELHKEVSMFASHIYEKRHGIHLESFPDVFCCAKIKNQIVGCLGLNFGKNHNPLALETYFSHSVIDSLSEGEVFREHIGEMGTRAVDEELARTSNVSSGVISALLTSNIIIHASKMKLSHIIFTSNRTSKLIAKLLDAELIEFGKPDLSRKDPEYLLKWKNFFSVPQFCFGVNIEEAVHGCIKYNNSVLRVNEELVTT